MNKKGTVLTSEVPSAVGGTLAIVTVFVASGQEVPPCMDNSTGEFAPCQIMLLDIPMWIFQAPNL